MAPKPTKVSPQVNGDVTPDEVNRIRASVQGKEQGPSTRQQSWVNWRELSNRLGQPFELERIPLSKLRMMRRDPMLGFGLSFIKTPIIRSKWVAAARSNKGVDAAISAHLDNDLRRIFPSFVLQWTNSLDFGYQAINKRFELRTPSATFIEIDENTGEQTEKPVWIQGNIQPVAWKPFLALPPENVDPIWASNGEFDGIHYAPASGALPGSIAAQPISKGDKPDFKIDIYHSLWVTNERDGNFGSIFGYPRLGYAYPYWWSYWFRWAISDRAFEKKADPSILVRHPDEDLTHPTTGEVISAAEYALDMGERLRSGGTLALPSDPYLGEVDGKPSSTYRWDVTYPTDGLNFEPFNASFEYLDVQKLRSLWIPEQAFLEGKGGTSSRNVAAEMGNSFVESQAVLAAQVVEHINRWLIPQWLAVNYPEFVAQGGTADIVLKGFADQDVEFTKQVIQLIGQQESGVKEIIKLVDLKRILEDAGTPIATIGEQKAREAKLVADAQAAAPPATAPVPGVAPGVVPTSTGFSYIAPREVITLSSSGSDFIDNLPQSQHYSDKEVRNFARELWRLYHDLYEDEYTTAVHALQDIGDGVQLMSINDLRDKAAGLLTNWRGSSKWPNVLDKTITIFANVAKRASHLELRRAKLREADAPAAMDDWIRSRIASSAAKISDTTRREVQEFIAARMSDGISDSAELADLVRAHFADFPQWKADRLVRTEIRDVYNAATLFAAKDAGVSAVQASDGAGGNTDADCENRDGQIFSIEDAFNEDEHPNGTLAWRILPGARLSVERVADLGVDGAIGRYDSETQTILLSLDATRPQQIQYLKLVADALVEAQEAA